MINYKILPILKKLAQEDPKKDLLVHLFMEVHQFQNINQVAILLNSIYLEIFLNPKYMFNHFHN